MSGLSDQDRELLQRFEARVRAALPGRVDRVVAFGSRARGDHDADSDLDVAVVLNGDVTRDDKDVVIDSGLDMKLELGGPLIIATVLHADQWEEPTRLVENIRSDGVPV
jgi:predicted nucleotidyltransferase